MIKFVSEYILITCEASKNQSGLVPIWQCRVLDLFFDDCCWMSSQSFLWTSLLQLLQEELPASEMALKKIHIYTINYLYILWSGSYRTIWYYNYITNLMEDARNYCVIVIMWVWCSSDIHIDSNNFAFYFQCICIYIYNKWCNLQT